MSITLDTNINTYEMVVDRSFDKNKLFPYSEKIYTSDHSNHTHNVIDWYNCSKGPKHHYDVIPGRPDIVYHFNILCATDLKYWLTSKNINSLRDIIIQCVRRDIREPIVLRPMDCLFKVDIGVNQYIKCTNLSDLPQRTRVSGEIDSFKIRDILKELSCQNFYLIGDELHTDIDPTIMSLFTNYTTVWGLKIFISDLNIDQLKQYINNQKYEYMYIQLLNKVKEVGDTNKTKHVQLLNKVKEVEDNNKAEHRQNQSNTFFNNRARDEKYEYMYVQLLNKVNDIENTNKAEYKQNNQSIYENIVDITLSLISYNI